MSDVDVVSVSIELFTCKVRLNPSCIYLLNNRNARTRCEIFSELTKKTSEQRHWRRLGVFYC